ncbi:MAG TPA: 1-deoxy-D-xylulose-5-phosphate reductoisomerase [Actinomycetes bacterium]|nr:1-deoxy-D-xylulose-5-phosphate reductoisomerase [Actinomycetes bacterium]
MPDNGSVSAQRDVVILGSTGSVGTQALDICRRNPDRFRVVGLAAGGADVALLAAQALELAVPVVAVARATVAEDLTLALNAEAARRGFATGDFALPRVLAGPEAASEVAALPADVVLNGITGAVGLAPTLAALAAGRTLALANKESLIVGGPLVKALAAPGQIVPVDSEHSAVAQCLRGGTADEVRRLVLTASGGPFRGRSRTELVDVTPEQALAHPNFAMGPVLTTNSATMMNKGLEVIEAHLLFDLPYDRIDVVVHPQQMIHSMVEFTDGSTLAQASPPSMLIPIALGLAWPDRVPEAAPGCDWTTADTWEFFPLDEAAFPAVPLARAAGQAGGTAPAVLNAANEECVAAFLAGRLPFLAIIDTVEAVLAEHDVAGADGTLTLPDVMAAQHWARTRARELTGLDAGDRVGEPL